MDLKTGFNFLMMTLAAIFAGYTLQPMPRVLDQPLKESLPLKMAILMTFVLFNLSGGNINAENAVVAVVISAVVLAAFEYLRRL